MNKVFFGDINSNLVLIQPVDEHDLSFIDNEIKEIKRLTNNKDFLLLVELKGILISNGVNLVL